MPVGRCSATAFYTLDARKVTRADRPRAVVDGAVVDITLRTPRPGQVHLADLPAGTPVLLADGTVTPVDPARARGRRGRTSAGRAYLTGDDTRALTGLGVPEQVVVACAPALSHLSATTGRPVADEPVTAAVRALAAAAAVAGADQPQVAAAVALAAACTPVDAPPVAPAGVQAELGARAAAIVRVLRRTHTPDTPAVRAQLARDVAAAAAGHLPAVGAEWQVPAPSAAVPLAAVDGVAPRPRAVR
jgi:hypothetical protein